MFDHKKIYTCLLALIAAVMFSACGSGSSDSADSLAYTGNESPAVIDAANAHALSSKALGIGFIDGTNADLAPLNKSIEILAGPITKGSSSAPVMSIVELLGEHGYDILEAFFPMIEGPIVPSVRANSPFFKDDFPNTGGSFSETLTETTVDTVTRFSGTFTFVSAEHCLNKDGISCTSKVSYDGAFSLTVDYLKSDIDAISDLPADWDSLGALEKLTLLMAKSDSTIEPQATLLTTDGVLTTTWTELSDGFGYVESGNYTGYNTTQTIAYVMDGTATRNDQNTDTINDQGFGKNESYGNLAFTGDLRIDMALDSPEGTMALDFDGTEAEITMAYQNTWESPASVEAGKSFTMTDKGDTLSLSIAGDATLAFIANTETDTLSLDATLDGGRASFTSVTDASTQTRYAIDTNGDGDLDYNETRRVEDNTEDHLTGEFAGTLDINATYTTTLLSPVTQTLGMTLNAGLVTLAYNDLGHNEFSLDSGGVPVYPENEYSSNDNIDIAVSFDGDLMLTNGFEPITLVGDFDFDMDIASIENGDYPELDDNAFSGSLTLNELTLKANGIDTTLQGALAFDVEWVAYRMSSDSPSSMLNLNMELLLRNNLEAKTYRFNDYKLGIALDTVYFEEINTSGPTISVSGRFYHPDYGYVDLSTADTPFAINVYAIEEALYMGDTDLMLAALFPLTGEMTLEGGAGSQAVMEALNTYSPLLDENISGGYTLSVDADGDGTFESGSAHTWPNLSELTENIWVIRLGMDVLESGLFGRIFVYRS